ncbi:MAG: long-chain-acyl-CoA synthetase [Myxococcota bacterium]|nr:long-chain-acyl-CoA synthetase [Myxococcota bacterium]
MWGPIDLAARFLGALPDARRLNPDGRHTAADLFERSVRRHGERPGILHGESGEPLALSYAELDAAANRVAWWALDHGLRRGDPVALLMENRPAFVATWIGLAKVGAIAALINTRLVGKSMAHALETSSAQLVVVGTECLDHLTSALSHLEALPEIWLAHESTGAAVPTAVPASAHDFDADLAQRPSNPPDPSVRDELRTGDPLFYIYTSGTTGLPKAARISHGRFLSASLGGSVIMRLDPEDVSYCALPLYHTAGGMMQQGSALRAGAALALRRQFSARAFWDDCRRFGATRFHYVGEFCRYLLHQEPRDNDGDHRVYAAMGNGLRPDIWREFQQRFGIERIIEIYGATEGNFAFFNMSGKVGAVGRLPGGRLGRRLGNVRTARYDIERDELERNERGFCVECAPGEPGELLCRISQKGILGGRFEGYTSAKATEQKVLRDAFVPGDSWFRTGDLLRIDSGGWLYFVDRIGDTFRWKGENVSTQEVAECLSSFSGLELVNVYGVAVEGRDGRAGMAALVTSGRRNRFDPAAFYAYVDDHLPPFAAPLFVRLCSEADVTGTLKLRKVALQQEGFDPEQISDPLFVRDEDASAYVPLTAELRAAILAGERWI